jgi:hypothetical protein
MPALEVGAAASTSCVDWRRRCQACTCALASALARRESRRHRKDKCSALRYQTCNERTSRDKPNKQQQRGRGEDGAATEVCAVAEMVPLMPVAQRQAARCGVRNCSVYSQDFVGMLSLLIDICDESGSERSAEQSAEQLGEKQGDQCTEQPALQLSQPEWQLAQCDEIEYATGAHNSARDAAASFNSARCSDMSAWSYESNSSSFSAGSYSSTDSASSMGSAAASQPRSFPGFWRRKQERRRLMTVICEAGATPDKSLRVVGGIYMIAGERKKWDGRQWRRVCCAGNCGAASRGTDKYCTVHLRTHSQQQQQQEQLHQA